MIKLSKLLFVLPVFALFVSACDSFKSGKESFESNSGGTPQPYLAIAEALSEEDKKAWLESLDRENLKAEALFLEHQRDEIKHSNNPTKLSELKKTYDKKRSEIKDKVQLLLKYPPNGNPADVINVPLFKKTGGATNNSCQSKKGGSGKPQKGCGSGNCTSVTYKCASTGSAGGTMDRGKGKCIMTLKPETCMELGIYDGSKGDPNKLPGADTPPATDADNAWAKCTFLHEMSHARDPIDGCASCQSETSAYDVSTACFAEIQKNHCNGGTTPPAFPPADCTGLDMNLNAHKNAGAYNKCLCKEGGDQACATPPSYDNGTCEKCRQQVYGASVGGDVADLYCKNFEKPPAKSP